MIASPPSAGIVADAGHGRPRRADVDMRPVFLRHRISLATPDFDPCADRTQRLTALVTTIQPELRGPCYRTGRSGNISTLIHQLRDWGFEPIPCAFLN